MRQIVRGLSDVLKDLFNIPIKKIFFLSMRLFFVIFFCTHCTGKFKGVECVDCRWSGSSIRKGLNYEVQSAPKVDILFIIDTSISMDAERKELSEKISGFTGQISHLDWQIAATTTTVYPHDEIVSVERNRYDRCLFDELNNLTPGGELKYSEWSDTTRYPGTFQSNGRFDFNRTNAVRDSRKLMKSPDSGICQAQLSDNPYNYEHGDHSEGHLTDFTDLGNHILNSGTSNAQQLFGDRIQGFPNGDAREQGIYAAVKAIQKYKEDKNHGRTGTTHTSFFRDDAALVFVLLADEDENSRRILQDKETGTVFDNDEINNRDIYDYYTGEYDSNKYVLKNPVCDNCHPVKFEDLVTDTFGEEKEMAWHSIVHNRSCSTEQFFRNGHIGYTYRALSELTGGIIGDVCAENYTSQLENIGGAVRGMSRKVNLGCQLVDDDGDGRKDIVITFKAAGSDSYQAYSGTYRISDQRLVFDGDLAPGHYQIDYNCSR